MSDKEEIITTPAYNLSKFKTTEILSNNTNRKSAIVLGIFPDISEKDQALIILEKLAFTLENLKNSSDEGYFSTKTEFNNEFLNDIYGNFLCYPEKERNKIKLTVIYPATQQHIEKYSEKEKCMIAETPAVYKTLTKPYIETQLSNLDWVYNILEHKKEKDRIIFEDTDPTKGFLILPDLKWDGKTLETLHVLALVNRESNLRSLRDLNANHLPLLESIRSNGLEIIEKTYGLKSTQLRVYIHYHPSFYHLHVHFSALSKDDAGVSCEKAHLLDTVINNIKLMADYYEKATIPLVLHTEQLLDKFKEDVIQRKKTKIAE